VRIPDSEYRNAKKDLREKGFGRTATKIAETLRGKNRVDFIPNSDLGNFVVLTNVKHAFFSGDKLDNKKYRHHSGYPGGLKEKILRQMLENSPSKLTFKIIRGMMPKNKLRDKQLKRLFIYSEAEHQQQAQEKNFIKINI
jgi:large subunit ribosomal protein L13